MFLQKIKISLPDRILEVMSVLALLATIITPIIFYSNVSEDAEIADKTIVLVMTSVAIITYIALSFLQRKPQIFNFPIPVTDQNRETLYTLGLKIIIRIKFLIMLSFLYANITSACFLEKYDDMVSWAFYFIIALIFIVPIYYIRKMYTLK
ncbi:hypothetical protein HW49_07025 [Porphyromonadaceae bacterium COT-184 OH4590]|nr:hypothetical protein HW49_07025 [Porphyromonadaceae bacterium COT-184 OH4590]MDO4725906.1 hypothetical protein [Porphyromonadaceae bacterium]